MEGIASLLPHVILENGFSGVSLCKVRWPEKTPGVGRLCGGIGSFFLDFLFLFHQGKRKENLKQLRDANPVPNLIFFFFCLKTKEAKVQDLKFFPRKSYGNKPPARSKPAGQL
jgi:hypothetical protein